MPLDYTTLTDRALCDAATAEIDFELLTYSVRDVNSDLADERTERLQSRTATQLTEVNTRIASTEAILALTTITAEEREEREDELSTLQSQRRKLQKRARQAAGLKEFLADVDMEQIAKQVEVLTSVKNGIAQHRATLSA